MTVYCSAAGCHNCRRKDNRWKGTTFFRFPLNNKELNDQWVIQLGRNDFVPNASSRLCSDHFEEECFTYQPFTNRRQLKPGSLPTKFNINQQGTKTGKCRRKKCRQYQSSRLNQFSGDSYTRESTKEVLMAASNSSSATDIASSSTSETQEMNDSSDDGQGKMYIIRCNPQNGVVVKKIESDGTESLVPSCAGSAQELSDQLPFQTISCRKRKACENCDEASERRHKEKMQKWDRFLALMEELVETCKSKNSGKPDLGEKQADSGNWPVIAEQLKQFVGLITIGKQNAYVKFELVD